MVDTCKTCKWFAAEEFEAFHELWRGTCRIRSTQISTAEFRSAGNAINFSFVLFPPRMEGNWCGEHSPKDTQ